MPEFRIPGSALRTTLSQTTVAHDEGIKAFEKAVASVQGQPVDIAAKKIAPAFDAFVHSADANINSLIGSLSTAFGADLQAVLANLISIHRGQGPGGVAALKNNVFSVAQQLLGSARPNRLDDLLQTAPAFAGLKNVFLIEGDVTQLGGADLSIVPGHRGSESVAGGGARGGIEQSWANHGAAAGLPGIAAALDEVVKERGQKLLPKGAALGVRTGYEPGVAPAALVWVASVPPAELRLSTKDPGDADRAALRKGHLALALESALDECAARGAQLAGRPPNTKEPLLVTVPVLCTGTEGCATPGEAGEVYKGVLESWMKHNPGFKIAIAYQGVYQSDPAFVSALQNPAAPSPPKSLDEVFRAVSRPFDQVSHSGVKPGATTLDASYVKTKTADFLASLEKGFPTDARTLKDIGATTAALEGRSNQEAAWQLFRTLTLPDFAASKYGVTVKGDSNGPAPADVKAMFAKLSKDAAFHTALAHVVEAEMGKVWNQRGQFDGDAKMNEILGFAVAKVLQSSRREHLDHVFTNFNVARTSVEMDIEGAKLELAKLCSPRTAATLSTATSAEALDLAIAELKKSFANNVTAKSEILKLESSLARQKQLTDDFRAKAESTQSSSRFSSTPSSYG